VSPNGASSPARASTDTAAPSADSGGNTGIEELKPNVAPDAGTTTPPPGQVNEIQQVLPDQTDAKSATGDSKASSSADEPASPQDMSSSKKKKKKHKLFF
jgi:hypothetical protein